jgi:hypothetical protein
MNKKLIFIFVVLIIFVYFQYNYINKTNDSFNIVQYENPNKNIFENMVHEKSISIFTKIQFDFNNNINLDTYHLLNNNNNKQMINNIIKQNINYYNIPLSIKHNFTIENELIDYKTPLTIQNHYRGLIIQLKGERKIYIFKQSDKKNLYFNKNNSSIDFWNQDIIKYPLLNKAQYIEIILRENQMIYIPYKFIYASITLNNNLTAYSNSESLLSYFLKH